MLPPSPPELAEARPVREQRRRADGELLRLERAEHLAAPGDPHELLRPAGRRHERRHARGERLRDDDPEPLLQGREHEEARLPEPLGERGHEAEGLGALRKAAGGRSADQDELRRG